MSSTRNNQRGVILDRDGTLVADSGFVHRVEDLRLLDGVVPGLRRLVELGFRLVIATNQSGVARGLFSEADMHAFNDALCRRLADEGITIEAVYCCTVHPTEGIGEYRCDSPLRKPGPGMILEAAEKHELDLAASYVIGDKKSDILAGQAAGCRTVLLATGAGGRGEETLSARADHLAADLAAAAEWIATDMRPAIEPGGVQLRIHNPENLAPRRPGAKKPLTNRRGRAT
jgi:D-glycero-D-manno-heptose 1,7-bisphosphate phosphatase